MCTDFLLSKIRGMPCVQSHHIRIICVPIYTVYTDITVCGIHNTAAMVWYGMSDGIAVVEHTYTISVTMSMQRMWENAHTKSRMYEIYQLFELKYEGWALFWAINGQKKCSSFIFELEQLFELEYSSSNNLYKSQIWARTCACAHTCGLGMLVELVYMGSTTAISPYMCSHFHADVLCMPRTVLPIYTAYMDIYMIRIWRLCIYDMPRILLSRKTQCIVHASIFAK